MQKIGKKNPTVPNFAAYESCFLVAFVPSNLRARFFFFSEIYSSFVDR